MRRARFLWLAIGATLAIAEVLLMPRLWPFDARPSLTFVLAAALAIRAADRRADTEGELLLTCWTIGLIKDFFTIGPLGGNAFVYVTVAAAFVALRRRFFVWSPLVWASTGFALFFAGHMLEGIAVRADRLLVVSLAAAVAETALLPVALVSFQGMRVALRGS